MKLYVKAILMVIVVLVHFDIAAEKHKKKHKAEPPAPWDKKEVIHKPVQSIIINAKKAEVEIFENLTPSSGSARCRRMFLLKKQQDILLLMSILLANLSPRKKTLLLLIMMKRRRSF